MVLTKWSAKSDVLRVLKEQLVSLSMCICACVSGCWKNSGRDSSLVFRRAYKILTSDLLHASAE